VSDRKNFDTLLWSFVTVFQILTVEDWPAVMYMSVDAIGVIAPVFFLAVIIMGQWILASLFVAILLDGFTRLANEEDAVLVVELEEFKQKRTKGFAMIKALALTAVDAKILDFFDHWKDVAQFKRTAGFKLQNWRIKGLLDIRGTHAAEWGEHSRPSLPPPVLVELTVRRVVRHAGYWAVVKMIQGNDLNFRDECFCWWKLCTHDPKKAATLVDSAGEIVAAASDRYGPCTLDHADADATLTRLWLLLVALLFSVTPRKGRLKPTKRSTKPVGSRR